MEGEERAFKSRENRLRRMAERQGLRLVRSRRRDPNALDYRMFCIADAATNTMVAGGEGFNGFGFDIDDVETWLTSSRKDR